MPQMSSMDWLMLSFFFLFIYYMAMLMTYFFMNFEIKVNNNIFKKKFFIFIW
uniref:ATP synthase F0 subunit 8 n=1 Tax=Psyttalia lounsburyi TaxID=405760 RepID=A0A8A4JBY6_9HYME|nr:ATP synthase F0 subunit 8 [Psyttalia lounsburyi]